MTAVALNIEGVLAELTLEEKASLTSGLGFWNTKPIERLGVPSVMMTDGPHGLRKQIGDAEDLRLVDSVPATCFPPAVSLGSSWDVSLLRRVGEALGREARANKVSVLLGPGFNIKRTPLCGRNFEYLSEDPYLSGELALAIVQGIESQGVGTSAKHFAANHQETDRMRVSADVEERTLRELYFPAFERVVKAGRPRTVMCSYNKINGVYASEHRWLLTEVLRQEWGFGGMLVSDWGAVHDRVASLRAGLDLQMPARGTRQDEEIVAAVRAGELDEDLVTEAARHVLAMVAASLPALEDPGTYDIDAHHALAREAAAAGAVLLKNDPVDGRPLLPLAADDTDLLIVGEFARTPRYQGAGSSQVHPTRVDDPLRSLRDALGSEVPFLPGFTIPKGPEGDDETLRAQAVEAARSAGTVLLFLGLPTIDESEGYDRTTIDLPANQRALLDALAAVNRRIVVVLANGGMVAVSEWRDRAPAIFEMWLSGQAGGSAVADLLLGRVSPSGRLAETIPHRIEDTPAFGNYPGEFGHVRYGEGVLVGYRWYDTRDMDVAYPFGHGLSYTTFAYSSITAEAGGGGAETRVQVRATITNTGDRAGAEVVQVYVRDGESAVLRPVRELKGFAKVDLEPGESREVTLDLDARAFSYWHPGLKRWVVEGGAFTVEVAASSRDVRGAVDLEIAGEPLWAPLDSMSTVGEWLAHPVAGPALMRMVASAFGPESEMQVDDEMIGMARDMPLSVIVDFGFLPLDRQGLEAIVA